MNESSPHVLASRMSTGDTSLDSWLWLWPLSPLIFVSDCQREVSELQLQHKRLEQENITKRSQVDNLSTRLSSLARLHKTLVGNHSHSLTVLSSLKTSLVGLQQAASKWQLVPLIQHQQGFQRSFLEFSLKATREAKESGAGDSSAVQGHNKFKWYLGVTEDS